MMTKIRERRGILTRGNNCARNNGSVFVGKCPVWGKPKDRLGPTEIATVSQTGRDTPQMD